MPKLQSKKKSKVNTIEVRIPITRVSLMSVFLALLVALVALSGYFGTKSLWNFTHPRIHVSFDGVKALTSLAQGKGIPPLSMPFSMESNSPRDLAKADYLSAIHMFRSDFMSKHPGSRLSQVPDNLYLYLGQSFCKAKNDAISKTGKFVSSEIISAHQSKIFFLYPWLPGLDTFIEGVGMNSFDHLCKG